MSGYTEEERRKAKELLHKDSPSEEEIEQINIFFGEQVRPSETDLETLKTRLNTYAEELDEYGHIKSDDKRITVENGTIVLKVQGDEPVVHIVVRDTNEAGGFAIVETKIQDILLTELGIDPPYRTHADESQSMYELKFKET